MRVEIAGLQKANILYTTYLEGVESIHDRFDTVQELAQYFDAYKRRGEVVGYVIVKNRTPGFKDYIVNGKLSIEFADANGFQSIDFDHVDKMVEFMDSNATIAMKLKYERKRRKR